MTPIGQFCFNTYKKESSLNLWLESEINIDLNELFIEYFEPYEVVVKKKSKACVKARLNTGKIFYPAYTFEAFKEMYYSFLIEYSNRVNQEPIGAN